jgi:hypothetical protein
VLFLDCFGTGSGLMIFPEKPQFDFAYSHLYILVYFFIIIKKCSRNKICIILKIKSIKIKINLFAVV